MAHFVVTEGPRSVTVLVQYSHMCSRCITSRDGIATLSRARRLNTNRIWGCKWILNRVKDVCYVLTSEILSSGYVVEMA
jgi:hypothetical protein